MFNYNNLSLDSVRISSKYTCQFPSIVDTYLQYPNDLLQTFQVRLRVVTNFSKSGISLIYPNATSWLYYRRLFLSIRKYEQMCFSVKCEYFKPSYNVAPFLLPCFEMSLLLNLDN